ncbi:MAG: division/cell wall cluster transcriptional repressor MraZ [Planctomycetes bacterium]|nr:division/cell wall cluster transcriptional repressor MraZ [Planctomycetota bacterium]
MLLTGNFPRTLDEKQRVALPKPLRAAWADTAEAGLYVAPSTDGSLALYSHASFRRLAERISEAPTAGTDVRAFGRLFYANASSLEIDGQGRIRIPQELAKWANLQSEVVLVGVGDHVELWDAVRWQTYVAQHQARYDQLSEAALDQTAKVSR